MTFEQPRSTFASFKAHWIRTSPSLHLALYHHTPAVHNSLMHIIMCMYACVQSCMQIYIYILFIFLEISSEHAEGA